MPLRVRIQRINSKMNATINLDTLKTNMSMVRSSVDLLQREIDRITDQMEFVMVSPSVCDRSSKHTDKSSQLSDNSSELSESDDESKDEPSQYATYHLDLGFAQKGFLMHPMKCEHCSGVYNSKNVPLTPCCEKPLCGKCFKEGYSSAPNTFRCPVCKVMNTSGLKMDHKCLLYNTTNVSCECPHYTHRLKHTDLKCKHMHALLANV